MAKTPEKRGLSAAYSLQFLALVERWGVSARELFGSRAYRLQDAEHPHRIVPVAQSIATIERARMLTGEPALGLYFGLQMSISAHGYLSFASLSAPTLREALALTIRYAPVRQNVLALTLEVSKGKAALIVEERADYGSARDVILLGLLVGIWHVGNVLLGREERETTVELALSEPDWYRRFEKVPPRIRWGKPRNRLVFDAALLDAPLLSSNPESLRLAREQCEQLLAACDANERVVERLRHIVLPSANGARSFEDLAAAVQMSPRTLRRKLAQEGASYSTLKEEARRDRAALLLRSSELSTKQIAEQLGYSNLENFIRAFRRWTGQTPAAFRRDRRRSCATGASAADPL